MKAYKGFNSKLQCSPNGKPFQYEVGKTYEEKEANLCSNGFHACESPLEVFGYYGPHDSRYCEVELGSVSDKRDIDSKRVGKKITIGAEIGIPGLVKAHIEYVKEHCTMEHTDPKQATAGENGAAAAGNYGAATAGYKGAATAGENGAATAGENGAATAGNYGAAAAGNYGAATAGENGAATAGNYGAATAGNYGAATAGNYGAATAGENGAAAAGNYGAATAGYKGAATAGENGAATAGENGAATAGNYGAATSRGSVSVGGNGVGLVRGNDVKVRGGLGAILVICNENTGNHDIAEWKVVVVDGKVTKVDTWYKLENGELVEVPEE